MIAVADIIQYMAAGSAPPGRVLARIAARQHGVVSRAQILALGVDTNFAGRMITAGRLHPVHLGVYAVGHPSLTTRGRWMAAVLAGGEGAHLSHFTAGLLWELIDRFVAAVHIVVADGGSRARPGIVIHRTRNLPADHRTEHDGIPVTSAHRTLLDLASVLPSERLRFAVEAADRKRLLDVPGLVALCDASPGRRGTGALRRLALEQRGAAHRTKSPPETLFLRLCIAHGLPEPLVNVRLHGYEVDFHWPEASLVVEIDTVTYHRSWPQRQRDLARDADLKVRGIEVLRVTDDRLRDDEARVFAQISTLLRHGIP